MQKELDEPLVVGIVGGIGAGKSTVAARLAELGAVVIDADRVGHEVLGRPAVARELVRRFGNAVVGPDSGIDRRALAEVVFAETHQRLRLEEVVHPLMREVLAERTGQARANKEVPLVVLDAAVLFEAGWDELCDRVVFVAATRQRRLQCLQADRGWSPEELARRESAQLPEEAKRRRAHLVVSNDGSSVECREQVDRLFHAWARPVAGPRESE